MPLSDALRKPSSRDPRGLFGHPEGLRTLFFLEMWERFSYYGLRPLLVLFMAASLFDGGFGLPRDEASAIVGIYGASVYLASLPGGWVADRLLGLRRAVFIAALLISSGHLCIGISGIFSGTARLPFYLGLILIVLGTGLLKPNISAMVGELYPDGGARRDAGFSIFYMGINIGAFSGQIVTGFLGEVIGWHWGFGAAGAGMMLGLFVYWQTATRTLGSIGVEPTRHEDPAVQARQVRRAKLTLITGLTLLALTVALLYTRVIVIEAQAAGQAMTWGLFAIAIGYFLRLFFIAGLTSAETRRTVVIAILFFFSTIFWSAFEQGPSSLNLFAADFTDRTIAGFEIPATWFQSINALFIILLAPFFATFWVWFAGRRGDLSSPAKFALGLLFGGLGFIIMIPAANIILQGGAGTRVSPLWLIGSYFLQTVGELCLSPVGLSTMTKLSPRKYVGQTMGLWFMSSAVGNLVGGLVGGRVDPQRLPEMPTLFTTTGVVLVAAAALLALLVGPIRRLAGDC